MENRRTLLYLTLIMATVAVGVGGLVLSALYSAAIEEDRERLVATARSQARLIEAIARRENQVAAMIPALDPSSDPYDQMIEQVRDTHTNLQGFGVSGEFTLARRIGDDIVFELDSRFLDEPEWKRIPFDSQLAEPMKLALDGLSGTIMGLDYRGAKVLAAYEPVGVYNLGIVAKIDLTEIRRPFVRAGLLGGGGGLILIILGAMSFLRIGNPLVRRVEESAAKYQTLLESSSEGVILFTDVCIECNDQACRIFDCSREDLIGHPREMFSPPTQPDGRDSRKAGRAFIEASLAGEAQHFSWRNIRKDGTPIDCELTLKSVRIDGRRLLMSTIRDVTKRVRAERALLELNESLERRVEEQTAELRDSEALYRALFESSQLGVILAEMYSGEIMDCNDAALKLCGADSRDQVIGQNMLDFSAPIQAGEIGKAEKLAEYSRKAYAENGIQFEWLGQRRNGETIPCEVHTSKITLGDRLLWQSIIADISERKLAEAALREKDELLSHTQRIAHVGGWELDIATRKAAWTEETYRIHGLDVDERLKIDFSDGEFGPEYYPPASQEKLMRAAGLAVNERLPWDLELDFKTAKGGERCVRVIGEPVIENGEVVRLSGTIQDITEIKAAEQKIRDSLEEKDVLLREVHHRVKNNLQVVSSLLYLQSREAADDESIGILAESRNRVHSMSLVHEQLYNSDDLAQIDFAEYVDSLVVNLIRSHRSMAQRVKVRMDVEDIRLGVDTAIPCGLIVNELVTNCLKHAFPGGRSGAIDVEFSRENSRHTLLVRDDGVGTDRDFEVESAESMGWRLVGTLARQLDGDVVLTHEGGTELRIDFEFAPRAERERRDER